MKHGEIQAAQVSRDGLPPVWDGHQAPAPVPGTRNAALAFPPARPRGPGRAWKGWLLSCCLHFCLLGGILAGALYLRVKGRSLALWSNLTAPAIALFHTFGRIGCFLGGCCYGIPSAWGVTYRHSPVVEANGISRFPVQLVEAAWNLILFLLLSRLLRQGKGRLLPLYLALYAPARFLLEFLRGDSYRGIFFGLSTSQWISLLLFPAALFFLLRRRN